MNKILLIIQREYLSRVRKKSFLILTFGAPLLFIGMGALAGFLVAKGDEMGDQKKVEVIDESGMFKDKLKNSNTATFTYVNDKYTDAKSKFLKSGNDYLLYIPASLNNIELYSGKKPSPPFQSAIEDQLTNVAQAQRLQQAGIDTAILAKAQSRVEVSARQLTDKGESDAGIYVAYAIGALSGFLIYMSIFIYGAQVMRGVIEEKISRIIEVIVSSVKPIQLMLGKIVGVGLVGLTQFALWIILTIALSGIAGTVLTKNNPAMQMQTAQMKNAQHTHMAAATADTATQPVGAMDKAIQAIGNIPVAYTAGCFLFYFLFGYFLYSAIFAAVGSAVDSETETQQFMLPITLPLVFTFIFSMNFIVNHPDSPISVWLSIIPFTAPIAMMARIPFGVPGWQLALSMFLTAGGFLFTAWVAARIYRVGILMYGKKASYKELAKWFTYKD